MTILPVILPIALAISAGWAARKSGLVPHTAWPGIETLSFRLLIPAILIHAIAGAELNPQKIGPFTMALVGTMAVIGATALALRRLVSAERLSNASLSTLFQTSTRWNAFISLAAADLLAGEAGVLLVAVAMAVLVPVVNVANIFTVAALVEASAGWRRVLRTVITNPLVIACAIGLSLNALGGLPDLPGRAFEIVGRAALGIGLLAVGAGIEIRRFVAVSRTVLIGLALRPVAAPAVFLGLALLFRLDPAEMAAGVLATAVPAATNGYIVARAMGGDAELYADMLAWQTLLSMIAIPAYLSLVAGL